MVNYTGTLSDGFRLFVVDGKGSRKGRNKEGGGGWREGYIGQVGIDLLEREESF